MEEGGKRTNFYKVDSLSSSQCTFNGCVFIT